MVSTYIKDATISRIKSLIILMFGNMQKIQKKKRRAISNEDKAFLKMMYHSPHHPVVLGVIFEIDERTVQKIADKKVRRTGDNKAKESPEVVYVKAGTTYRPTEIMEEGDVIYQTYKNKQHRDKLIVGCPIETQRLNKGLKEFEDEKGLRKKKEEKRKGKKKKSQKNLHSHF